MFFDMQVVAAKNRTEVGREAAVANSVLHGHFKTTEPLLPKSVDIVSRAIPSLLSSGNEGVEEWGVICRP
jgi:hypothetical protein